MPPVPLTSDQESLFQELRELAETEFAEKACTWEGSIPWENVELLAGRGLLGMAIPEEYGGAGHTELESLIAMDAVGRVCPDTAAYEATTNMTPRAIAKFGTEEAKEKYLPRFTAGEASWAIAISEPHAGSDVNAMSTHIEEDGGDLYLNGEKTWVGLVGTPRCEVAMVWTRWPDDLIGSVVIDLDSDGVEIVEKYTNMAGKTQTHFRLNDVRVPPENVLIRDKDAMLAQVKTLNWERLAVAMRANCNSRCALEHVLDWVQTRKQFDQTLNEFQGIQWMLSEMVSEYEATRGLIYNAARNAVEEDRDPTRLEAGMAKYSASEAAERIVSDSLQLFGARGFMQGHALEYLYRLQRGRRISHGTNELMKNGIAEQLFKHGIPE